MPLLPALPACSGNYDNACLRTIRPSVLNNWYPRSEAELHAATCPSQTSKVPDQTPERPLNCSEVDPLEWTRRTLPPQSVYPHLVSSRANIRRGTPILAARYPLSNLEGLCPATWRGPPLTAW